MVRARVHRDRQPGLLPPWVAAVPGRYIYRFKEWENAYAYALREVDWIRKADATGEAAA